MFDYKTYDIENDSDILAMESELSMIDFAMESAQCEIAFGNEEYQRVVEAAFAKKQEASKGLLGTIIDKAQKLLSSLIKAVSDAMNRIHMFITGKQIKSAEKKLSKAQKAGLGVAGGVIAVGGMLAAFAHGKRLNLMKEYKEMLSNNVASMNMDEKQLDAKAKEFAAKDKVKLSIKDLPKAGNFLMTDLKEMGQILKQAAGLPGEQAKKVGGWISSKFKLLKRGTKELDDAADKTGEATGTSSEAPAQSEETAPTEG